MKVTHHISFDLQKHGKRQIIYVKQGDELSREIAFSIYNDGTVWTVPADVTIVQFAYCKSDHIGGCYDKMPDDTDAGSFNDSRTVITMQIHPQVLNVAGNVICELRLLNSDGQILNSFNFYVSVEGSPIAMTSDSEGYYNNIISRRAVLYTEQTLTDEQKAQARENIGAISSSGGLITGPLTMDRDCGIVLSHSSATDQVSLSNKSGKLKIRKSVLHDSPAIVRGIATPEEDTDAANKAYVDDAINAAIGDTAGALAEMDDVIGGVGA